MKTLDRRLHKFAKLPREGKESGRFKCGLVLGLDIVDEVVKSLNDGPLEQPEVDALVELVTSLRRQCRGER